MSMRFHQAKSCQQLLPSTLLHLTNCCLLNVFLDDSSSRLPGYARDTFRARWAFVIGLCNSSFEPSSTEGICDLLFEISRPTQAWRHLWFVIMGFVMTDEHEYWLFMMTQEPTISTSLHCSEFSQDPQEFRKRGAVSPFVKLSSGVR